MNPHFVEAIVGGVFVALPVIFVQWLMGRDVRTRLVVKVETHDADIGTLKTDVKDHEGRIIVLEQRLPTPRHHMGD